MLKKWTFLVQFLGVSCYLEAGVLQWKVSNSLIITKKTVSDDDNIQVYSQGCILASSDTNSFLKVT